MDTSLYIKYIYRLQLVKIETCFYCITTLIGTPLKKNIDKLLNKHQELVHTDNISVVSHVQREEDDWVLNTLMLENIGVPFKYKRKKMYKSLKKQKVNITYYPGTENIAGFDIEIMNIVRIRVS